jgi:hypothetical protein
MVHANQKEARMSVRHFFVAALTAALFLSCGPGAAPGVPNPALDGIRLGTPIRHGNLTVIPVFSDRPESREELVPLKTALEKKWLEIKETDEGDVSRVILNNLSDKNIFILSGEVISGCKQDRIISGDRIIQAKQRNIDLDVFCVESGRWNYESNDFYTKENIGTATLREKAQRKSAESQDEIWGEIARVNAENKVESESDAYQDIYDQKDIKKKIDEAQGALAGALDPAAVGVIIGIGGKVKSVDVFENKALFAHYWPLILKSSALTAATSKEQGELSAAEAEKMLVAAKTVSAQNQAPIEKDRAAVAVDATVNTSSLKSGSGMVHFSAFPVEKEKSVEVMENESILNIDNRRR